MKALLTLLLLSLIVSGCGKLKGDERSFANAVITDVND
jgi:ABC-type Fe3+-citrate transport system substrate-binding protein